MEGKNLIELAIAGDKDAFCRLYGQYKDRLYRYAFYRLDSGAAAEDAVSECVLAAWSGIRGLRSPDAFSAWLFRILSACCSRQIRKQIEERDSIKAAYENRRGTDDRTTDPQVSLELSEALQILSEEDRDIVLLSVIAGLTSNEIGSRYGLPPGTVRSRLSRSLGKLRSFLEKN